MQADSAKSSADPARWDTLPTGIVLNLGNLLLVRFDELLQPVELSQRPPEILTRQRLLGGVVDVHDIRLEGVDARLYRIGEELIALE